MRAKTKHYRIAMVSSKALPRYTHWASQSHDKTFLEFIVESRASSLNEFLTLRENEREREMKKQQKRIMGPKTSDSFSIASCVTCRQNRVQIRKSIAIYLTYLVRFDHFLYHSMVVVFPNRMSFLFYSLLCFSSSHSIPITKCIDSRFPCTISFITQLTHTHTHLKKNREADSHIVSFYHSGHGCHAIVRKK